MTMLGAFFFALVRSAMSTTASLNPSRTTWPLFWKWRLSSSSGDVTWSAGSAFNVTGDDADDAVSGTIFFVTLNQALKYQATGTFVTSYGA